MAFDEDDEMTMRALCLGIAALSVAGGEKRASAKTVIDRAEYFRRYIEKGK